MEQQNLGCKESLFYGWLSGQAVVGIYISPGVILTSPKYYFDEEEW